MRLLMILVAIACMSLFIDANAGLGGKRWCAEFETGIGECGFRTQTRCLQVAQRGAGTCREEDESRLELRPAMVVSSLSAEFVAR